MKIAGQTMDDIHEAIRTRPDFIAIARFKSSLKLLLERYPEGVPIEVQSQALVMTPEAIEAEYQAALAILRDAVT